MRQQPHLYETVGRTDCSVKQRLEPHFTSPFAIAVPPDDDRNVVENEANVDDSQSQVCVLNQSQTAQVLVCSRLHVSAL